MPQSEARRQVAHLLRRFGLGVTPEEMRQYSGGSYEAAVDQLLNFESQDEGYTIKIEAFRKPPQNFVFPNGVQCWWVLRMIASQRPLQEKMALFWHDHFATSFAKVGVPFMYQQNETLRQKCIAKFEDLLVATSKDPAMLFWLDNQYNVRGKPNENFAREVLELFTFGVDNGYTEKDVQEAARAFTGWSAGQVPEGKFVDRGFRPFEYRFNKGAFDAGPKKVLGETGPFTGEQVISIICRNTQTSKYLTWKLLNWFVYANPEPSYVDRMATIFRDSGLDLKVLLKAIMLSPEFQSPKSHRAVFKNPVDFVVPIMRQLGYGDVIRANGQPGPIKRDIELIGYAVMQSLGSMGMNIMFPPDVNGWESGQAWITTSTIVERVRWADRVFAPNPFGNNRYQVRGQADRIIAGDTPEQAVRRLLAFFDAEVDPQRRAVMEQAARKVGTLANARNSNQMAAAVSRLIFGSPEFQLG